MPHIITHTEEIEEHGYCQQRPEWETGQKYLLEVDGKKRLRIVQSVHLDKYVWEKVAQWTTTFIEYFEEEYILCTHQVNIGTPEQKNIPVFVADGMLGVLSCDKDQVEGTLAVPSQIGNITVKGVAPFGFYECKKLTRVGFAPRVVIVYECAFAKSGIKEMFFNEMLPVLLHITAVDDCEQLPKFSKIFDRPFPGKYLFRGGAAFSEWEESLYQNHFLIR